MQEASLIPERVLHDDWCDEPGERGGYFGNFSTVTLVKGRSLRLGPDWTCSDALVLFDCHSGDYWVISLLAAELMKLLLDGAEATTIDLERQLGLTLHEFDFSSDLMSTLHSLSESGLVLLKS